MQQIVSIQGRSEQGLHRPFLCTAEDGNSYYVKGASMGFRGLCAEWIGGRLAGYLGLPIPEIEIVEIAPELLALLNDDDQKDLGIGPAFGSRELVPSEDFLYSQIESVSPILKGRILLFDWWTCNIDRILGTLAGNPNMIWSGTPRQLFIIDHNLTFSSDSELFSSFWQDHVFHAAYPWCDNDWKLCRQTLSNARLKLKSIWEELPEMWTDFDGFRLDTVDSVLSRCETKEFWEPVTP